MEKCCLYHSTHQRTVRGSIKLDTCALLFREMSVSCRGRRLAALFLPPKPNLPCSDDATVSSLLQDSASSVIRGLGLSASVSALTRDGVELPAPETDSKGGRKAGGCLGRNHTLSATLGGVFLMKTTSSKGEDIRGVC